MATGGTIRVRACLAVVRDARILLVTHANVEGRAVMWVVPGGGVAFGESLRHAAEREFGEETGYQAIAGTVVDVAEVIRLEPSWHSVTITFVGAISGGEARPEIHPRYGARQIGWFALGDLALESHPWRVLSQMLQTD